MLRWVDELSPEHFVVLLYCSDPPGWFDRHELERRNIMGPRQAILEAAGLSVTGDARALVLKDLNDRRLIDGGMLGGMVSASSAYDPVIKDLGRELLAFVRCFDTTHPDSQSSASPQ
ncbi:MAG: hypothetical protein Q8K58_05170, partial [Acidimicrobiales bacterium]|nr:hypothetical protein [Acidimicrobiales bacterium]